MSDEIGLKSVSADDGEKVDEAKPDTENKEPIKPRTVSFNRDVHVKRFGKPRESRIPAEKIRKEPFTHLSEQELIDEANKVLAQAKSVTCTADNPPEKFFSLPHRRKLKDDRSARRNSDDATPGQKTPLGRSVSDASGKKKRERTSLSTLFRKAQRNKSPDEPVVVTTKPIAVVKRSKSDVTDLKSNTTLNTQTKPIRKRSGSETEEFLKSLRNKKSQLSPIIESSPREDYFKNTPPLEVFQKEKLSKKLSNKSENKVQEKINPVEKPPRYKSIDAHDPKPPLRTKRGKSAEKDEGHSNPITETPKRKIGVKKTFLVDEIDSFKPKDINPADVKDKIKSSIRKLEENIYADKEMIHSSQQPPEKPPLTRGHTVDHLVRILKEDQFSPPLKSHLISSTNGSNINQPFSYLKPSVSPDPNLFARNSSPDRITSPVNKMADKGVIYAQVYKNGNTDRLNNVNNKFTPPREKHGHISDEDEGLGYDERYKYTNNRNYEHDYHKTNETENFNSLEGYKITDSPIRPRFREYKLTSFEDFEPTYANEYTSKNDKSHEYIEKFRGRGDGMDTKKKTFESEIPKVDLDFNELSHRRQLLESRINARKFERDREKKNYDEPITRYLTEKDPLYEAEKRMQATERYVNETARYIHHTLERDGFAESTITEDFSKYDSDNQKLKYNTETRTFSKVPQGELDRREFIDKLEPRYKPKVFPPEPEYEPPSLELNTAGKTVVANEYKEKKYKVKKHLTSSQDLSQSGQRYKKDEWFGKRKGHYASNPEIAQEREEEYANLPKKYSESYHNSLRRVKNKDRFREEYGIRRHNSGDSREYYRDDRSPRRYEIDNRLVDSGIENDFRKDSSGEIHVRRNRHDTDDEAKDSVLFLDSERRHAEDNYPAEQIYANGEYLAKFKEHREFGWNQYEPRERSADDRSHLDTKNGRYGKSPSRLNEKVSAKPPKATKKLSGLEKMKQLFSRDSSKKSKKEKEVQPKTRTRVLKSPEHLAEDDSDYKRYTDPEPSEIIVRKVSYDCGDVRRYKNSKEDFTRHKSPKEDLGRYTNSREELSKYRSSELRDSEPDRNYKNHDGRYARTVKEDRRYQERIDKRRHHSSDRDSDRQSRPSDGESELRKTRSRTAGPMDSPALYPLQAERYRERRRLATPSPPPSPPARPPRASSGTWLKSLDRLTRKKGRAAQKVEKESILTTEDESNRKWSKTKTTPLASPAKNLRFFGDTDQESDTNAKHSAVTKSKSHPQTKTTLRKTVSNSSNGVDEVDHEASKSYSLTNLRDTKNDESSRTKSYYKRNLGNISEIHSNSETESHFDRKLNSKPPISPYERSRSHSSSKTLKGESRKKNDDRGSSSELRSSKQELNRDSKPRRRTPATNSGESSTEGDSSHQSQRSVVYLHATTVGDIPNPGRMHRNRSRDDVSSVNSSNFQVKSTTKSFSLFAPWTPKHSSDQTDVHYAQRPRNSKKEIVKKASSTKTLNDDRPAPLQKKSYSQTTLTRRPQSSRLTNSSQTLYRKPEKRKESQGTLRKSVPKDGKRSQSSEVINRDDRERVSRSISMPKDENKKAGWFKLSSKNKKPEPARVR